MKIKQMGIILKDFWPLPKLQITFKSNIKISMCCYLRSQVHIASMREIKPSWK